MLYREGYFVRVPSALVPFVGLFLRVSTELERSCAREQHSRLVGPWRNKSRRYTDVMLLSAAVPLSSSANCSCYCRHCQSAGETAASFICHASSHSLLFSSAVNELLSNSCLRL